MPLTSRKAKSQTFIFSRKYNTIEIEMDVKGKNMKDGEDYLIVFFVIHTWFLPIGVFMK
jgi:hypothetical protein